MPILPDLSDDLARIAAAAAPSLVALSGRRTRMTGWVWRPGLVVTAEEAIGEEKEFGATLAGGERRTARLAGRDAGTDLALLRVDGELTPAALTHATPRPGALAMVAGAREGAATAALASVLFTGPAWKSMRGGHIEARIELNHMLRGETEGGLVLDAAGQAIGMAVSGPRRRTLVIPAATAARVLPLLEQHGGLPRGKLGVALQPARADGDGAEAAIVMSVERGGAAEAAGIRQGDLITAWDGAPLRGMATITDALGPESIGRTVQVGLRRGGEAMTVPLTVGG